MSCDPSKQRLGFIIDDNEPSAAVDQLRDMVIAAAGA